MVSTVGKALNFYFPGSPDPESMDRSDPWPRTRARKFKNLGSTRTRTKYFEISFLHSQYGVIHGFYSGYSFEFLISREIFFQICNQIDSFYQLCTKI